LIKFHKIYPDFLKIYNPTLRKIYQGDIKKGQNLTLTNVSIESGITNTLAATAITKAVAAAIGRAGLVWIEKNIKFC
jgi:hypothetical protein